MRWVAPSPPCAVLQDDTSSLQLPSSWPLSSRVIRSGARLSLFLRAGLIDTIGFPFNGRLRMRYRSTASYAIRVPQKTTLLSPQPALQVSEGMLLSPPTMDNGPKFGASLLSVDLLPLSQAVRTP